MYWGCPPMGRLDGHHSEGCGCGVVQVFLVDVISLTRISCAQPMSYYTSLVVLLIGFKLTLAALLASSWLWQRYRVYGSCARLMASFKRQSAVRVRTRRRATIAQSLSAGIARLAAMQWAKVFKACFFLLFLFYPAVSIKIFQV